MAVASAGRPRASARNEAARPEAAAGGSLSVGMRGQAPPAVDPVTAALAALMVSWSSAARNCAGGT